MRALIALLVLLIASDACADAYARGREKQHAGTALLVVGTALLMVGPPLLIVGMAGDNCAALPGESCGQNPLLYVGIGLAVGGFVAHAVGLPLYIAGTVDVDRWRDGKTASLTLVRF